MSKGKKIATLMIVILLIVAIAIGGVIAIVNNKGSGELDDITRTEKLTAPKNLAISDDWVLTWDLVDRAISYYVVIDGQYNKIVQVNSLDVSEYGKKVGNHSFSVRAMHSLASFHSDMSQTIYKAKTMKLDTPSGVAISSMVFSWGRVSEAKSYELLIEAKDQTPVVQYSSSTEFDLSEYIATHPDVSRFTVKVKATALDRVTGTTNAYIEDSEYSETKTYIKAGSITAPVLRATFENEEKTQKGDERSVMWNIDPYVETYEVWLDGKLVESISRATVAGIEEYTLPLANYQKSDTVGDHSIYVVAVPVSEEGITTVKQQSNTLNYSVNQKLEAVRADSIVISMEGSTLIVSWEANPLATYYTINLRGRTSEADQFRVFDTMENNSGARYSIQLTNEFGYREVQARVMACAQAGHKYIQNADFSDWSQSYSTITKLNPVGVVRISESSDEKVTASWAGNNQNLQYMQYIGSFYCRVYYATTEGGEKHRGETAFDFTLPKGTESFTLSDILKGKNMPAGLYSLTVVTMPTEEANKFFLASDATDDVFFNYKTRLDVPNILGCKRIYKSDGTNYIRFVFFGSQGAASYNLTITGQDVNSTVNIPQPANYDGEQIVDIELVNGVLGAMTEPRVYNFALVALAPAEEDGKLMDSRTVTYSYSDVFKHAAVDSTTIEFQKTGNTVVAKWGVVPTARAYSIQSNNVTLTATTNSVDITNSLKLGNNTFTIRCQAIPGQYDESVDVSVYYEYHYTITGTAEIESRFVEADGERYVEVSIPHFDERITGYAIQFGTKAPQMMTIDAESGKVIYKATIDGDDADLPLYQTTAVTIFAGVSSVDGGVANKQDYIVAIKTIDAQITNDFSITAPTLSVDSSTETLNIALVEAALKYTQKVEYSISLGGRILYNGEILRSEFYDDANDASIESNFAYSLRKIIKGSESSTLDVGEYRITATIFATSGISADATAITYTKRTQLDNVDESSFVRASDNTYLQWNAVDGADSYVVTVTHNGSAVENISMPLGEYVDNAGNLVVRLNTISLFGEKGVGSYVFSVIARSNDANVADSPSAAIHEWIMATTLVQPTFTIEVYNGTESSLLGKVVAKILKNALAEQYVITVNGQSALTVNKNSSSEIYQYVALEGISAAGRYVVTVQATRNSGADKSEVCTQEYVNVLTAEKPNNVSATQNLDANEIIFTSDKLSANIVNGAVAKEVDLTIEARISTLTGEEYQVSGETVWFTLTGSGSQVSASLDSGALTWLRSKSASTFLVFFRTQAYSDADIYEGELLTASGEVPARLSYQNQLTTPEFSFDGGTVVTAESDVVMTVSNLDANANDNIDIQITRGDWSKVISAQKVNGGKVSITAEMLEDTRGEYSVKIRATSNGIYLASPWTTATQSITCATPIANVTNVKFNRVYNSTKTPAEGGNPEQVIINEARLNISFDPINEIAAGEITYNVEMNFAYSGKGYNLALTRGANDGSRIVFTLDYSTGDEYEILRTVLGETPEAGLALNFVIVATPTNTNLYLKGETKFVYTVGQVAAPQNFVFTQNGGSVTVTWTGDDAYAGEEYTITYTYNVVIKNNAGDEATESVSGQTVTAESATFDLPSDYASIAYLVEFRIVKVDVAVSSSGTTQATFDGEKNYCGDWFVNKVATQNATLAVDYDTETKKYTGTITHNSNNGEIFNGQTYGVAIAGSVVASDLVEKKFELSGLVVSRLIAASGGQTASSVITISNSVYKTTDKVMVAYEGKECNVQVILPLVVTSAPTGVNIDQNNEIATITNIPYVTQYAWRITKKGDSTNVIHGTASSAATATSTDIKLAGFSELAAGEYTLYIKAESDTANKIYADGASEISLDFERVVAMDAPYAASFTTTGNNKGDFVTTLSWNYGKRLDASRFAINFVSVSTGANYKVDMAQVSGDIFTVSQSGQYYVYSLVFNGLDLVNNTNLGYDPTRTMPASDYKITIQVIGNESDYSTDSAVADFQGTYKNKFGVVAVSADAFAVAPECFFGSTNVVDGTIVFGESESEQNKKNYLSTYESRYGFNRKYLVITQTGSLENRATSYRVIINGTDFGIIDKASSIMTIDFDSIAAASKLSLGSVWKAGVNAITLMPYTSNEMMDYYYYVDGQTQYQLTTETAQLALTKQFDVVMYQKFSKPSDPRVELGYSDAARHNINKVNVSFANSSSAITYNVTIKYNDYYDNNSEKVWATLTGQKAVFNGSQNVGLMMYDIIKAMGPHNIWFEISQTGVDLSDESLAQYYIDSDVATTTPFVYTTAMPEFSDKVIANQVTSVVTAIDSETQDPDKVYKQNGALMWTLPVNAYDMVAEYKVSLKDTNNNLATKTAHVSITVTADGIVYSLIRNDNDLFYIDSENNIYFDMTEFFWNREAGLSNGARTNYYLAGEYYYMITAKALDKNEAEATGRIYDPDKPTYGFVKFAYKDINYPLAPSNAVIDKDGVLSWDYDLTADVYSSATPTFVVTITTYKAADKTLIRTITLDPTTSYSVDISSYLVAGGAERNDVYVYRVSPNEFYKNSLPKQATFASDYVSNLNMPNITASWTTKYNVEYGITDSAERVETVLGELNENNSDAKFVISMLRVTQEVASTLGENENFDTIANQSAIQFVRVNFDDIVFNFNASAELNYRYDMLNAIEAMGKASDWLDGSNFIPGRYFVKVEFMATNHPYYTTSTAYVVRDVKNVWAIVNEDEATLTGEYLTTKAKTATTATVEGQNDREWAETDHKQAILSFNVYAIKDFRKVQHLPKSVSVRVKLWNGTAYVTNRTYEITYYLPELADLLNDVNASYKESEDGDSRIYRVNGVSDYYNVRIDIHKLFDYSEPFAANYAGVYALEYVLNEDEIGSTSDALHSDGSSWYLYTRDICHYTVISTPILDYRLGLQQIGSEYAYVLNWVLTPNKYTYIVNNDVEYNLNIFAFKKGANGKYACDDAYAALDETGKQFFLQNESALANQTSSYGFVMEKLIRDFSVVYEKDGRRCYINDRTNVGLELEPNNEYKFFVYLTPKTINTQDPNAFYYLRSETSAPQEYLYKAISAQHYGTEITSTVDDVYVVENQKDFLDAKVYDITSNQDTNNYNNGFELFIYDTQDVAAGQTNTWTLDQEVNKTYLAHYIITTLNNVSSNGNRVPLYVVDSSLYIDGKNQPLEYLRNVDGSLRQIGVLVNSSIEINGFTLRELLGETRAITPITYYCKIKSWINNNELNANAFVSDDGMLEDVELYGEKWIRKYLTNDDTEVSNYLASFEEQGIKCTVPLADYNSLNPSYYFTFQHTIRFMQPEISKIEIVNNEGASDVNGECVVDYANSSSGVTAGYIVADSNGDYTYKIYLNNVYNADPIITLDKYIQLNVATYEYEQSADGTLNFNNVGGLAQYRSTTLKVYYDGTTSYVMLGKDSVETNARAIYNWIDSLLPNKIYFTATAVMGNPNQRDTTGGANTTNKFIPNAQDTNKSSIGYGNILRSFAISDMSNSVSLTVKKQYTAPLISFKFDNSTTGNLIGTNSTQKTNSGNITNVLASGEYGGMALNPYLYVDGASYESIGAQGGGQANYGFEYVGLSNRTDTYYEVVFGYNGKSVTYQFKTKDINATMVEFTKAVAANPMRYNYSNYQDVYPYEIACMYEKLYNLINEGAASDAYHGGTITTKIRVIAPTDPSAAGYWISSDYRENADLSFYVRLETVQTEFNENEAQFADTSGTLNMASMYKKEGFYYYYQGYIPFKYHTISKDVKYRVTLTRPNTQSSGNFVYSYDVLRNSNLDYARCQWTPTATGQNIGNLADILAIDQFTSSNNPDQNQWVLDSEWSINILAYADNDLQAEFVTRGFDSNIRTYSPKLKIVNDITNILINMDVDMSTYTVGEFGADNISVSSSVNTMYNAAASVAEFTYDIGSGKMTKTVNIKQNVGSTCYKDMVEEFVRDVYINNSSVTGGKYYYSVRLLNYIDNVENSETKSDLVFEYYRQISAGDFTATVEQVSTANNYITIKASVGQNMTISGMNVKLAQTILSTATSTQSSAKSMTRGTSGSNYTFETTWAFNRNYADCFLSGTAGNFSSSDTKNLTQRGYVTNNNKGNIQAGYNTFYFYPVQDAASAKYNLWKADTYIPRQTVFIVPSSYNPTIDLTYSTSSEGGTSEAGARYSSNGYYWRDYYTTAYYRYVNMLKATVTNADGYSVSSTWTYGWKKNAGESTCTKTEFSKNGSSSNLSTASYITLSGNANYANYFFTLNVKSGYAPYFVTPSVQEEIHPDVSGDHHERKFEKTVRVGKVPTSSGGSSSGGSSSGGSSSGGSTTPTTPTTPDPTPSPVDPGSSKDSMSPLDKIIVGSLIFSLGGSGGKGNLAYEGSKQISSAVGNLGVVGAAASTVINAASEVAAAASDVADTARDIIVDAGKTVVDTVIDVGRKVANALGKLKFW